MRTGVRSRVRLATIASSVMSERRVSYLQLAHAESPRLADCIRGRTTSESRDVVPRGAAVVTTRLLPSRLPPGGSVVARRVLGACALDEVSVVIVHGDGALVGGVRRVKGGRVSIS